QAVPLVLGEAAALVEQRNVEQPRTAEEDLQDTLPAFGEGLVELDHGAEPRARRISDCSFQIADLKTETPSSNLQSEICNLKFVHACAWRSTRATISSRRSGSIGLSRKPAASRATACRSASPVPEQTIAGTPARRGSRRCSRRKCQPSIPGIS